jgi:hypothetical protein
MSTYKFIFPISKGGLHNEELNDLDSSPNIIRVIKSRRMRLAGHVARIEEKRGAYRILLGRSEGDPSVDGRIILKWVFNKWDGAWTGLSWLTIVTGGGLL